MLLLEEVDYVGQDLPRAPLLEHVGRDRMGAIKAWRIVRLYRLACRGESVLFCLGQEYWLVR